VPKIAFVKRKHEDLVELTQILTRTRGVPGHIYLIGATEGGIITA
jgi:hypothetical protein